MCTRARGAHVFLDPYILLVTRPGTLRKTPFMAPMIRGGSLILHHGLARSCPACQSARSSFACARWWAVRRRLRRFSRVAVGAFFYRLSLLASRSGTVDGSVRRSGCEVLCSWRSRAKPGLSTVPIHWLCRCLSGQDGNLLCWFSGAYAASALLPAFSPGPR